jgi:hypothetical protein
MSVRSTRCASRPAIAVVMFFGMLGAGGGPIARGDEASKAAKIVELMRLKGSAQLMMEQSKAAGQVAADKMVQSMTDQVFAQTPAIPPDMRARIEGASQQFLREVDSNFDPDDAVQAWRRFYADGLTEKDVDAILAYYRSAVGQKDVLASQAALPQFQRYLTERHTAALNSAVVRYTAALREIANPSKEASVQSQEAPMRVLGSNPSVPEGKVVSNSVSERCEIPPSAATRTHDAPPSGRSVLCVCVDEKGTLTQDPLITESSGDSKVDSGAVKLARSGSGRYSPPTLNGKPQRACFRFAINFRQQE